MQDTNSYVCNKIEIGKTSELSAEGRKHRRGNRDNIVSSLPGGIEAGFSRLGLFFGFQNDQGQNILVPFALVMHFIRHFANEKDPEPPDLALCNTCIQIGV